MKKVEVWRTTEEGQELDFTVTYDGKEVDISQAPTALQDIWRALGIPYPPGKPVKPKDGEVFLKAVARDFNGSYARSGKVIDDGR
jgi:hypothetical protein